MSHCARLLATWIVATLFPLVCVGQDAWLPITIEPFNPRPGDAVTAKLSISRCLSFDRLERSDKLISIYVTRNNVTDGPFNSCLAVKIESVSLGALPAAKYAIELVVRDPARPTRDYVSATTAFVVSASNLAGNAPTRIEASNPIALVRVVPDVSFEPIKFRVIDATGRAVSGAAYRYELFDAATNSVDRCLASAPGSLCVGELSGDGGVVELVPFAGMAPTLGSRLLTWAVSVPVNSDPSRNGDFGWHTAFTTIGYTDAKRRDQVIPVVEYEILHRDTFSAPPGYFLATSESEMKALDDLPAFFRRTFAGFLGVRESTPGAQPVCRFLKVVSSGRYFHWFTADAADCAAKRNDPAYVYEGTSFWAYPARADGGCPRDTRGVTRYLFELSGKTMAVRYSMLTNLKSYKSVSFDATSQLDIKDGGVAFCVPD